MIRIFGSGFNANTSVWIWANQARVAQVGSTEIDVTAPARNVAGKVDVAVFSNGGVSRLVNGYNYLVGATPTPAPPTPTPTPTPTPSGTNLSACADITKSGSYTLTQNVSSGGTCFFIDADNITL
ncbi:MAG TPA: hypothetical protein VNX22_00375, partial [Acidobacteriaceae bacterium]|nr:hypothetical protein [Acidobacteriaceae bacterium]